MQEQWKDVPSFPEMMASSWGRVQKKPFVGKMPNGSTRLYKTKPRWGVEQKCASGREGVRKRRLVYITGLKKSFNVARLVCEAFNGPPPDEKSICIHIDENPSNNRPENLKWGTAKENLNGEKFIEYCKQRTGENSPRRKGMK